MKKLILIFVCTISAILTISAQQRHIPLADITRIANENAEILWGTVYPADPIPYYSVDGEIVAWRFNYSIGEPFPSRNEILLQCDQAKRAGQRDKQWGENKYGRILMGASESYPVIIEYSQTLSVEYALGQELESLAQQKLGTGFSLEKVYYVNESQQWFCYSNGLEPVYINPFPPIQIKDKTDFLNTVSDKTQFIEPADYSLEWDAYLSGKTLNPKAAVYISNYELCPFYDWSYGCSPTAAAMLFGLWDYRSLYSGWDFGLLIEYYFNRYDDIEVEMDYGIPWMQRILAIKMETDTTSGTTNFWDIREGIEDAAAERGYSFDASDYITSEWDRLRDEVDANRPLIASIPNHSTTCIGYNNSDNHFATHYTHQGSIVWVHKDELDGVVTVEPESDFGQGITLTYPEGDTNYNSTGNGEVWYMGEPYTITWDYESTVPSTVTIFYSINGNGGFVEDVIVYDTYNDGSYEWFIPRADYSDQCRIGILNFDSGDQLIAADGNQGMFTIYEPPHIPLLSSGVEVTADYDPDYFRFQHTKSSWCVVAVRAFMNTTNWDIKCYPTNDFNSILVESDATEAQTATDFIVIDGNHAASSTVKGIRIHRETGDDDGKVVYEGNNSTASVGTQSVYFAVGDVAMMHDVHLVPGYYTFSLTSSSGSGDADMALFSSQSGVYYQSFEDAMAISNFVGNNVSESFTVYIENEDDYGLCVYTTTPSTSTWTLEIEEEFPGIWEGDYSMYWDQSENWSLDILPDASTDVVIPAGTTYSPFILDPAFCDNMTIESGANLYVLDDYLFVYGDMLIKGYLNIDIDQYIYIFGDITWTSTASEYLESNSSIYIQGNWTFDYGSEIFIDDGHVRFVGGSHSLIYCRGENSYFHHVHIDKNDGGWVQYEMTPGLQPLRINGDFYGYSGCSFTCPSLYSIYFKGEMFYAPDGFEFKCSEGDVYFAGATYQSLYFNPESYFNNLIIASSSQVGMQDAIDVNGDLIIQSGSLACNNHTIEVGGDWTNNVGVGNFIQGTGTVVFNGYGTQECDGEEFYNLELNKGNGELRFHEGTTECENYNWTQGAIRVNGGTFTANDLVDDGIYGTITITAGELNFHQDEYDYIDLRGDLTIEEGTMTVYGGGDESYWPYLDNASITMSGGILDFKDVGIRIQNPATYTFTANISGGRIRTAGEFRVFRPDFNPTGGLLELYSSNDATLSHEAGSNFYDVMIKKPAAKDNTPNKSIIVSDRDGNKSVKAITATVTASTDLDINGYFHLDEGIFVAPTQMNVAGDWSNIVNDAGFVEGLNTVIFDGNTDQYCNFEVFFNLTLAKSGGELILNADDVFCTNYDWVSGDLKIDGGGLIVGDLVDNGLYGNITLVNGGIEFNQGTGTGEYVDLCGNLTIQGGYMSVIGGADDSFWPYLQDASLTMTNGSLDFKSVGIHIYNSSSATFTENISGGTIRTPFNFTGNRTDFTPSGGTIECYGNNPCAISMGMGSNLYHLEIDKSTKGNESGDMAILENRSGLAVGFVEGGPTVNLLSEVELSGNLTVQAADFNLIGNKLTVKGNTNVVNAGLININYNSIFNIGDGSYVNIANGGEFEAIGMEGAEALITSESGQYGFKIAGGGLIRAQHAIFEYMDENGIYVEDGSVDILYPFNNCTFRNGSPASGSCLLKIQNAQNLSVHDALFTVNSGSGTFNVTKSTNQGQVDFYDATGIFSGEAYDEDPFNRINWISTAGYSVALTVFLEGPFETSEMQTNLNLDDMIPKNQPYNSAPWNYSGSESVSSIPNTDVVDWVLVEMRDAPSAGSATEATAIGLQAAFLLKNGSIVGLDGSSVLYFTGSFSNNLFAVVYHRNHLGIISASPLTMSGDDYIYNFSTGESQVYGGSTGHKQIVPGTWGMMGGDGTANGSINTDDMVSCWENESGEHGYLQGDFNLDCQVDNIDKNDIWLLNNGEGCQVPE